MPPLGIDLLYEQGPCLVVCKPGGLLTQAPPGIDSLEVRMKEYLRVRDKRPGKVYLGVVHRLDRPASGALLLGRHARATRRLCEQFEGRTVGKTYWALVAGHVTPDEGTWTDCLRKVPGVARAEVVAAEHPEGRRAVLHYRVLERTAERSWLEIELETGRTHQVRVQAAVRGHPVCGDVDYGSQLPFGPQTDDARLRWIALHARRLQFRHPMTREKVDVTAPLPEPWQTAGIADAERPENG